MQQLRLTWLTPPAPLPLFSLPLLLPLQLPHAVIACSPYRELNSITFSLNVKFIRPTSIVTVHSLTLQPRETGTATGKETDRQTEWQSDRQGGDSLNWPNSAWHPNRSCPAKLWIHSWYSYRTYSGDSLQRIDDCTCRGRWEICANQLKYFFALDLALTKGWTLLKW